MTQPIATAETGTSDAKDVGKRTATLLYVEFLSAGNVKVEATLDGGDTWLELTSIGSTGIKTLSPSPETIRVSAENGAEVNVGAQAHRDPTDTSTKSHSHDTGNSPVSPVAKSYTAPCQKQRSGKQQEDTLNAEIAVGKPLAGEPRGGPPSTPARRGTT